MQATCYYCGRKFEAERSNARYCSDKCRSAAKRLKDRYGADGDVERQSVFNRKHNFKRVVAIREVANIYPILENIEREFGAIAAEKTLEACWLVFTGKTLQPLSVGKEKSSSQGKVPKPSRVIRDSFLYDLRLAEYNAREHPDDWQPILDKQIEKLRLAAEADDPVAIELMQELGLD